MNKEINKQLIFCKDGNYRWIRTLKKDEEKTLQKTPFMVRLTLLSRPLREGLRVKTFYFLLPINTTCLIDFPVYGDLRRKIDIVYFSSLLKLNKKPLTFSKFLPKKLNNTYFQKLLDNRYCLIKKYEKSNSPAVLDFNLQVKIPEFLRTQKIDFTIYENFTELYRILCFHYFKFNFRSLKKYQSSFEEILAWCSRERIDPEVFLFISFRYTKYKPNLMIDRLCLDEAKIKFSKNLANYSNFDDVVKSIGYENFLEMLVSQKRHYESLRNDFSPEVIFKTRISEFNAYFLSLNSDFLEFYKKNLRFSVRKRLCIDEAVFETEKKISSKMLPKLLRELELNAIRF